MTLPGYRSTGVEILQAALDRAAAGETVNAAIVLDQLDVLLAAHMGMLSEAAQAKPGSIITALRSVGYSTPHEVLAAASGVVGSALVLMPAGDRGTWVKTLVRAAEFADRRRAAGGRG